jgi:hypothetical protein
VVVGDIVGEGLTVVGGTVCVGISEGVLVGLTLAVGVFAADEVVGLLLVPHEVRTGTRIAIAAVATTRSPINRPGIHARE